MGVPLYRWMVHMEKKTIYYMDDFGVPPLMETSTYMYIYIYICTPTGILRAITAETAEFPGTKVTSPVDTDRRLAPQGDAATNLAAKSMDPLVCKTKIPRCSRCLMEG